MNEVLKCLIITDYYFPCSNANAICVRNLVDELKKNSVFVDVITSSANENVLKVDSFETIYFIKNYRTNCSLFSRLRFYPIRNIKKARSFFDECKRLTQNKDYSFVLFVVNPIESLYPLISLNFNKRITKIIYELDSISSQTINSKALKHFLIHKSRLLEKRCYMAADFIIHMECHEKEFEKPNYKKVKQKFLISNFPLFVDNKHSEGGRKHISADKIKKFIFCGTLDKGIRDPIPCLNIIKKLSEKETIVFDFFSKGDYEEQLKTYTDTLPLVLHGFVSPTDLEKHMVKSSCLISIGNKIDNFVPSKMYSYLTYRKPIIHFYEKESDPCLRFFSNVKHCLFIDVRDDVEKNAEKIAQFINKDLDPMVFDVSNEFEMCKPSFTVEVLKRIAKEHNDDN